MAEVTLYVTLKVKVEVDTNKDVDQTDKDEVSDAVSSNADYSITLDAKGLRITDTEMIACSTDRPDV